MSKFKNDTVQADARRFLDDRGSSAALAPNGLNPATIMEKAVKDRIVDSYFYKEQCFALNEADIVDCGASLDYDAQVDPSDAVSGCEYARRLDIPIPVDNDADGTTFAFVDWFFTCPFTRLMTLLEDGRLVETHETWTAGWWRCRSRRPSSCRPRWPRWAGRPGRWSTGSPGGRASRARPS